jgi:site-specific DNA-methyltransferase (adenine-specific)
MENQNNLILGDCLELMKDIPDKFIDMILCDLPYGTTACKWDVVIPFASLWEQYKRIIKDNGCIALFGTEPFSSHLRMSNLKMYKYDWVWEKDRPSNFANAKYCPLKYHETISIFNAKNYYPQKVKRISNRVKQGIINGNKSWRTIKKENNISFTSNYIARSFDIYDPELKYPMSVLKYPIVNSNSKEKTSHPTQKPVALLEYLIKTYTVESETILDNCMGSGSTGVACKNLQRNFIGIEKDPEFFEIAKNRIENHKVEKQLFFDNLGFIE